MKQWIVLSLVAVLVVGCRTRVPSEDLTKVMADEAPDDEVARIPGVTVRGRQSDAFYEGVELDFDFQIDRSGKIDRSGRIDYETRILRDDQGCSVAFGLDPTRASTTELDIQFLQDHFACSPSTFFPQSHLFVELRKSCEASGAIGPRHEFDACELCGRVHEAATRVWRQTKRGVTPTGYGDCFSCKPTENCFWCELCSPETQVFFERIGTDFDFQIDDHGAIDAPTPIFPDEAWPALHTVLLPPIVPADLAYIYLTCWNYTKAVGVPIVDAINRPAPRPAPRPGDTFTIFGPAGDKYGPAKSPFPHVVAARINWGVVDASGEPVKDWVWDEHVWFVWLGPGVVPLSASARREFDIRQARSSNLFSDTWEELRLAFGGRVR